MNIKVQCCGVILITLLAIIYGRQRKLNLITSRVFQGCFFASLFCLCMDILSLVMIVYREKFPLLLTEFICKTYLVSLVLVALLAVVYIATSVAFHLPYYKKNIVVYVVLAAIFATLIYALPIYMHENVEMDMAWTDGACIYATYLGIMVFVAINLIQIFRRKEYIYDRQRRTVLIWMLMWMIAACIQVLDSKNLLAGFAIALGITVIFFQFENPELNLDWKTGLFNYVAYTRYGEQLYSSNKDFYLIAVMYENTAWQSEVDFYDNMDAQKIFNTFLTIRDANVFKIMENEVLIFFSSEERARTTWKNIVKWSKSRTAETAPGHPAFYYVEDPRCVSSYGELLELLQYVGPQRQDVKPGSLHTIESNIVSQMVAERRMTQQIAEALEEDRVIVYYQPIYSIEKQCFVSAEALVRIIDREGNLIPPASFVHIAEGNGMIIEIGKRVFEKVCHFFQQSRLEEYGIQYIDVNLSVVQCADAQLADTYIKIMNDIKIKPHCINLEITESASLREKQTLITNMEQMIKHGIMFSLDDFGTGQSNLNYIMEMPVKVVKFDREMIQSYFTSDKAKYVMDAAMQMIHGMEMKIVAEGIETEEQYKKMEEIKIGFIQGYYFSKPLPEQEFLDFLQRENGKNQKASF
ncbi:MAG: EAL domain-containing protein [Lachnospiraceae bacterium]|nr:EAL domain-containing protein [Lachnospiraceae bacterium]